MTDHIYEDYKMRLGGEAAELMLLTPPGNDKEEYLNMLYRRLTKSSINTLNPGSSLTVVSVLYSVIFHYGCITQEQYLSLFPSFAKGILYNTYNRLHRTSDAAPLRVLQADRYCHKIYALTDDRYARQYCCYPEAYLDANGIGNEPRAISTKNASHMVSTLDVPYRLLRDAKFQPFCWYTSVLLTRGMNVRKAIDSYDRTRRSDELSNAVCPDGILQFENSSAVVEQDQGTERYKKLEDKHLMYGSYLSSLSDADILSVRILFNIKTAAGDDHNTLRRAHSALAGNIKSGSVNTLSVIAESSGLTTLAEIKSVLDGKIRSNGNIKLWSDAMSLLSVYESSGNLPLERATLDDLESYIEKRKELRKTVLDEDHYGADRRRCESMSSRIQSLFFSDDRDKDHEAFRNAIRKGAGYIVTNTYDFDRYARFILPAESDVCGMVLERAIRGRGFCTDERTCFRAVRGLKVRDQNSTFIFPNGYLASPGAHDTRPASLHVIAEISSDIGERIRVTDFARRYTGSRTPVQLVLLVRSVRDAVSFCRETGLISRFMDREEPTKPSPRHMVSVCFIDYSADSCPVFIPDTEGNIRLIR